MRNPLLGCQMADLISVLQVSRFIKVIENDR